MDTRTREGRSSLGRNSYFVVLLAALGVSCGHPATPSPAPPPRPNPPVPNVLAELASAKSTAAPEPPPPLPSTEVSGPTPLKIAGPLQTDAAKKELAEIRPFCAPAVSHASGTETVGCACCPPFDLCAPNPAAKLVEAEQVYPLRVRVDGAFTGPAAHEAALVFDGCESHAQNYGGTLLVDLTDPAAGKPHAPDYRSGLHPSRCEKLRTPRGNDALLCEHVDSHQGDVTDQIFAYDFTNKDAPLTTIYTATDDTLAACDGGRPATGTPVVAQHVEDFSAKDANGDGVVDVMIQVAARRGKLTKAYADACNKAMNQPEGKAWERPDLGGFLGPLEVRPLTFLGKKDGTFAPTSETTVTLKAMNAEHDAFFHK